MAEFPAGQRDFLPDNGISCRTTGFPAGQRDFLFDINAVSK